MQKLITALLLLSPALAFSQTGQPRTVQTITPIFHQLVAFNLPTTFNIAAPDQSNQKFYLHEIPLRGESVERWTQLITLNGFRGAVSQGLTAERAVTNIAGHFKEACPASFAAVNGGPMTLSGRPAYLILASCGNVADVGGQTGAMHSETALLVGLEGDQDVYTLQWAERGPGSVTPLPIDQARWKARFQQLNPIHVCPRVEGEAPPYPSCLGK